VILFGEMLIFVGSSTFLVGKWFGNGIKPFPQ